MSKIRTFRVATAFLPAISTHRAMADGVAHFAARHGDWILCALLTRPDARQAFPALTPDNFDGAIGDFTQPPFNRLLAAGASIPLIVTDPEPENKNAAKHLANCGRLTCDNASIANAAADALLARGAASFLYVDTHRPSSWSMARERVFVSRIRAANAKCTVWKTNPCASFEEDTVALMRLLKTLSRPVAAFIACDARAQEFVSACRLAGLAIPDDIAILSVDNDESVCLGLSPALSSIQMNARRGGYLAAAALDKAMRGSAEALKEPVLYGFSNLVERTSTVPCTGHDALTDSARRLIAKGVAAPGGRIRIRHLTQELGVSRRTLESRFKRATGRTLLGEIIVMRLNRVKDLLVNTDATLQDIAEQTGFASASHLTETFRRAYDISPGAFRSKATDLV